MSENFDPTLISLFHQLPGCWGCKDLNSIFVYANHAYGQLIGVEDPSQCIGRSDFDMPSPTTECAAEFQRQDKFVMATRKTIKILDIHPYPDGRWHAHIFTKKPWLDDNGDVIGTIFFGKELTDTAILEVGHWICRATGIQQEINHAVEFNTTGAEQPVPLSQRESESLFLLLYGKKPQYIARAMGISVKTVEGYIAKLKTKFDAKSKDHLINKALDAGFGSVIPKSLLKTQLSVVLNNECLTS